MAKMKRGPKTDTQHRHVKPPNLDLGERPCPDCGRPIRIVLWHGGGKRTPAERYELDGRTKHRCHVRCPGCGQPVLIAEGPKLWQLQSWELDGRTAHRCDCHLWYPRAGRAKTAGNQHPNLRRAHLEPKPPKAKEPAPLHQGRGHVRPQVHLVRPASIEAVFGKLRRQRRPGGEYAVSFKVGVRKLLKQTEPLLDAAGVHGEALDLIRSCIREWCLEYYGLWGSRLAQRLAYTYERFRGKGVDPKALEQALLTVDKELGPPS